MRVCHMRAHSVVIERIGCVACLAKIGKVEVCIQLTRLHLVVYTLSSIGVAVGVGAAIVHNAAVVWHLDARIGRFPVASTTDGGWFTCFCVCIGTTHSVTQGAVVL